MFIRRPAIIDGDDSLAVSISSTLLELVDSTPIVNIGLSSPQQLKYELPPAKFVPPADDMGTFRYIIDEVLLQAWCFIDGVTTPCVRLGSSDGWVNCSWSGKRVEHTSLLNTQC